MLTGQANQITPTVTSRDSILESDKHKLMWQLMSEYLHHEPEYVVKQIEHHVQFTLSKPIDIKDPQVWLTAVAASIKDRLIECFNDTQQYWAEHDAKRIYLLSPTFTMGRRILSSLISLCLYDSYHEALTKLGINLETLLEQEKDEQFSDLGLASTSWLEALAT